MLALTCLSPKICLGAPLATTAGCGTVIEPATCEPACGPAIAAAVGACSEQGGGSVFLGPGNFPLMSARSLQPSLVLANVHNVVVAGAAGQGTGA